MSSIAIGDNQCLWIAEETTPGVAVWPVANDTVLVSGDVSFKQERIKLDDPEKKLTRGKTGKITGPFKAGEFSFSTLIKPSGSQGVTCPQGNLFTGLFGKETVTPSTSVGYTLYDIDDEIKTYSILVKDGHIVKLCTGCAINTGRFPISAGDSDDALVHAEWGGVFLKHFIAGTDNLDGVHSVGTSTLTFKRSVMSYSVGAKVVVGGDHNTGGGFTITGVNVQNKQLTLNEGLNIEQADGAIVKGWTPLIIDAGYAIHGRFGVCTMSTDGGSTFDNLISTLNTIEINNGVIVLVDEKSGNEWPDSLVASGKRTITYSHSKYFKPEDTDYEYHANNGTELKIKVPCGNVAGKRVRFEFEKIQIGTPGVSGDNERSIEVSGEGYETAALNDSIKAVFD